MVPDGFRTGVRMKGIFPTSSMDSLSHGCTYDGCYPKFDRL